METPNIAALSVADSAIRAARLASDNYCRVLSVSYFGSPEQVEALEAMNVAYAALREVRDARRAAGLCCTQHVGVDRFVCDRRIDLAAECSACTKCQAREEAYEGACDSRASLRCDAR